jgi:tetratricopeptide (TPR) repeat protein
LRGGLLEEEGRWDAATKEYESVLRAEPGQLEARIGLCRAYAGAGDAAKAAACYDRALALFPGNPVARFAYAGSLAALGRTDMAVKMYREALRLEPAYVEAWVNLGVLYREAKRYKEARPCYEQALKFAAPGDPVPEYSYAMLLERMGKTSDAASHYEAALRQNPGFESARRRLATLGAVRR